MKEKKWLKTEKNVLQIKKKKRMLSNEKKINIIII